MSSGSRASTSGRRRRKRGAAEIAAVTERLLRVLDYARARAASRRSGPRRVEAHWHLLLDAREGDQRNVRPRPAGQSPSGREACRSPSSSTHRRPPSAARLPERRDATRARRRSSHRHRLRRRPAHEEPWDARSCATGSRCRMSANTAARAEQRACPRQVRRVRGRGPASSDPTSASRRRSRARLGRPRPGRGRARANSSARAMSPSAAGWRFCSAARPRR